MIAATDQRTFERIPYHQKVKVASMGQVVAYAMAINIGMGGVLLHSASTLPVGSKCQLAIPMTGSGGMKRLVTEGTVIRSDTEGTAVQFLMTLERARFYALFREPATTSHRPILASYQAYFRVSRNQDLAGCEKLLGVSKGIFRTTFYITFLSCISLAILPAWLYQNRLPASPDWVKVVLSFGYGALWLTVIQPTVDLTIFHFLKQRQSSRSGA